MILCEQSLLFLFCLLLKLTKIEREVEFLSEKQGIRFINTYEHITLILMT